MPDNKQQVLDQATTTFRRLLNFRRPYDALRLQWYAQYLAKRKPIYFPDNVTKRSNTSVPYAWANVEEINSRVQDAYFGMEPWLEVRPRGQNDGPAAEAMDLVLNYMLRKAEFARNFETLVRNILIYGHCAMKVDWDWDFDTVNYPQPVYAIDPRSGQPLAGPDGQPIVKGYKPSTQQIPRMCPKFIPIDVYDFLLDPDGGITAHLTERTWAQIKREAQAKPDLYFPEALQELGGRLSKEDNPDSCIIRIAEIWNDFEKTTTVITTQDTDAVAYKDTRAAYRSTGSYSPYKRKVFAQPPILLWHGDNPFLHKRSPVLHTGYVKLPNEPYGIGAIEPISDLSDSLDRFTNMISDNWNLGINKRYAYDANMEIDHEALNNFNIPGGKVGMLGDPNKAIMPLPTFTPNAGDYQILGIYKNFIELASGVSDFYSRGVGSGGANNTATGINDVISESSHRFKLFIRNLEFDVVQPMLQMVTSMIQQFTTDPIEIALTENQPAIAKYPVVRPEQLIGNYNFEIVAANYTSNKVIKQRNFLAFANWAAQTPYWNQYEGLREVAKVFEIRNTQRVLNNPQMVEFQQQQAHQEQLKLALAEKLLDTEGKMLVAEARTVSKEGSNKGQDHALKVQSAIEEWLQGLGDMPGKNGQVSPQMQPTGVSRGGGRPRGVQQEGAIPGSGTTSLAREVGQGMGANGLGLSGMGEGNAIQGT